MKGSRLLTALGPFLLSVILARATSNYIYGSDEYDTVIGGISPNGKYAIATHGSSANYGYDGFRVFLIDNLTGKRSGRFWKSVTIWIRALMRLARNGPPILARSLWSIGSTVTSPCK